MLNCEPVIATLKNETNNRNIDDEIPALEM